MELRDYQVISADIVEEAYSKGINPQLVELPTGTGKTVVMGEIARRRRHLGRILFTVHRQEILHQTVRSFEKTIGETAGIVMANVDEYFEPVVCASIQTLANGNRMDRVLDAGPIGTVFIDECHHYTPESVYARLIQEIQERYPNALILGVSATPYRMDKVDITTVFRPVFRRSIQEMQKRNWLAESQWLPIYIDNMHLEEIATRIKDGERDFTVAELSAAMLPHAKKMAALAAAHIGNRQTAVFAVSIPHMWALYNALNQEGISTGVVYGDQDKYERRNIIRSWKAGNIQAVVNVGVLTEGFDYPEIACLVMARPTQSASFYTQMLGRGLRVVDGKIDLLVIDFTGHPQIEEDAGINVTLPDILGITETGKGEAREYHVRVFKKWSPVALVDITEQDVYVVATEVGTFGIAENRFTGLWDIIQIIDDNHVMILNKTIGYSQRTAAEKLTTILERVGGTKALWKSKSAWRKGQPSAGQMSYLSGISPSAFQAAYDNGWNKGDVSNAITRAKFSGTIRRWRKRQEKENGG